ncbi:MULTISPECIES: hypothetical protein [Streptomyces]|uniref:Integral membrane protein n=2 Tax=Streptomyces griseiscabiei TaxID=2993540 RepID=A0ABU4LE02_9ACTN|nr:MULTISPECIES: hypothetical protein [Streptomyces]MBZ3908499.1 hypothetical protein [Streptomyces griseiscabiei]MDX2914017.1 hypothetical protein [Streptomyces griseiscabiei]
MTYTTQHAPRRARPGFFMLPFALAARVFRPSRPGRLTDGAIESAQLARTVIGIAATIWMIYAYPMQESMSSFAKDKLAEILISTGVLVIVGPLTLVLFVAAARAPGRAVYARRLSAPMTGFGALFASVLVLFLLLQNSGGARLAPQFGAFQIVFLLVALAVVLFAVPFGLASAFLCVHYVFRTGDVHEVLPPLLSPLLVWVMFGFQLADGSPVAAPQTVQLLFLVGPPLSVTLLSAWELRRLRTKFGVTILGALHRGRRPTYG